MRNDIAEALFDQPNFDRDMDYIHSLFNFIEEEEIDNYGDLVESLVHCYAKVAKPDAPGLELPFWEWHKVLVKYSTHFQAFFDA